MRRRRRRRERGVRIGTVGRRNGEWRGRGREEEVSYVEDVGVKRKRKEE